MYSCFASINSACEFWKFCYRCCFFAYCTNRFSILWELRYSSLFAIHPTFEFWYFMNSCFTTIDSTSKFWKFSNRSFYTINTTCEFWYFVNSCFTTVGSSRNTCSFKTHRKVVHTLDRSRSKASYLLT